METMGGRREEIYWEKVPSKVRHEAVDKALRLLEPETTWERWRWTKEGQAEVMRA